MQTERVTFLTTPDHKAALDAFAAGNGKSVGHVLREASARYLAEGDLNEEEQLSLALRELDAALPAIHASLDRSIQRIRDTRHELDAMFREAGLIA